MSAETSNHILFYRLVAPNGKQVLAAKWDKVDKKLNASGGAKKDGPKWKKCYEDLKYISI